MRRWTLTVALAALALAGAGRAEAPAPFFPVAVWYGGGTARAPMLLPIDAASEAAWRKDLETIKALGFNTVRTWVEWSAVEPREGAYRFDNLDLMLKLAEQVGLKVIVQVYVDSAPEWVGVRYPDGRFVSQGGTAIPSQAAPGFCVDHPGVRAAVLKFFGAIAARTAKSPAFYAYDLWSEPAVMNWAQPAYVPNAQFCYCPHSIARFRDWLRTKHASLDDLNRAWYRTFTSWDQVAPPRFGTILTYADFMDWRVYIGDKIAADLGARARAVRAVDPEHLVTSHAPNPSPVFRTLADAMDASDDYLMKDVVDYFGTSFYPKLTSPDRDFTLERRALVLDAAKSVTGDRGFYVGELQAGFGVHGVIVGNPVTPRDLEIQAWSAVARGARSISFYAYYPMSTGYESGGYGLVNLDGSRTTRSVAAGLTARTIAANADLLLTARPAPADVAIVFNPLTPLLGGEQAYGDRRSMHRAVAGYHRMFFERNIPVDIPSARELSPELLRRYKLVIVPYPILLTAQMAAALEQYARGGGRLFVEARPGWQDERGHAEPYVPGFNWHRLFGVLESEVLPAKQVTVTWGSRQFTGTGFQERFDTTQPDTRTLATFDDGWGAAFERSVGDGRTLILGTFAGERNAQEPVPMHPLGDLLVEWAALARPNLRSSAFIELRRLMAPGGEFLFLFNHGSEPVTHVEVTVLLARPAARIRELTPNEGRPAPTSSGTTLSLSIAMVDESVRVYRIDY